MIPQSAIEEWRNKVPWQTNEQVEQDLIICRVLTETFKVSCPNLAWQIYN